MPGTPLRVVVVEDNPADARLILRELRQAGFEPDAARVDTEAAFAATLAAPPDVVLCDYNMPQYDAMTALRMLRKDHPEIPFIIVSGSIGEETAVDAIKEGATDYLLKDRLGRLAPAVVQAMEERKLREAERSGRDALKASERQYRQLADSIPQIVWTAGPNGDLDYLNRRALEYSGLELEGLTGWAWERVVHPDDLAHTAAIWGEALRVGEPREFEFRIRRAEGAYRWHITRQVAVRDATGTVARWFGTCTDIDDQKAAAAQLARDALVLASVRDSVIVTDLAGVVTYWNEGATKLFGWTAAEMLGRNYAARFPESERPAIAQVIGDRAGGSDWNDEFHDYRKGGSRVWIDARVTPVADAQGLPVGIMGIAHDITDRKRAEAERDSLLERLRIQIERMPLAYMLTDADLRVIDWNAAAERIFGYAKAEMLGSGPPFEKIVPRDAWPMSLEIVARIRAGDMAAHSVNENVTKDGRTITCEWSNTPLLGRDGAFLGLFSLAQDITARREVEKTLEMRDRAIRAATQGILITDASRPDHPIIYASPAFEQMTGYPPEKVIGRNCRFLQGKETDPAAVQQIRAAVRAGESCTVELLNYRKDGTPFWNSLSISPVLGPDGRLAHFVGVQTDVTVRRRLETQFRQAQKMEAFGQLAGGVAHDFNNLLTVINGYSDLLLAKPAPNDSWREALVAVREAGDRAAGLTAQLLAFSRKSIIEPKVLDLNVVVEAIAKMLRRLIGEDVRLVVVLSPTLSRLKADLGQVEQVIMNLAVNARDAMPTGGRLTIETADTVLAADDPLRDPSCAPGRYVRLTVADTGTGMPDDVKAKIFEPFFTTKGVGKGTGLGLATVYGIVTQAGGQIAVASRLGAGTTFTAYFPAVSDAAVSANAPGAAPSVRGTETILLVEDEDAVRKLAKIALEAQGYKVLAAHCGAEAVRLSDEHPGPIHLMATDVVMPTMGGREVAELLRPRRPDMRVLYLSGYTDDAVMRHGVTDATDAFLQKPFTPLTLARKVRSVLDGRL